MASGSAASLRSSKNRYISYLSDSNHEAAPENTNHDWLTGIGIVHNPDPVLCPSNGDIQAFELPKSEIRLLMSRKQTLSLTSWIRGAYCEPDNLS